MHHFRNVFLVGEHFAELLFFGTYFGILSSKSFLNLATNVFKRSRFILLNDSNLWGQSSWIRHDGSIETSLKVSLLYL